MSLHEFIDDLGPGTGLRVVQPIPVIISDDTIGFSDEPAVHMATCIETGLLCFTTARTLEEARTNIIERIVEEAPMLLSSDRSNSLQAAIIDTARKYIRFMDDWDSDGNSDNNEVTLPPHRPTGIRVGNNSSATAL